MNGSKQLEPQIGGVDKDTASTNHFDAWWHRFLAVAGRTDKTSPGGSSKWCDSDQIRPPHLIHRCANPQTTHTSGPGCSSPCSNWAKQRRDSTHFLTSPSRPKSAAQCSKFVLDPLRTSRSSQEDPSLWLDAELESSCSMISTRALDLWTGIRKGQNLYPQWTTPQH
ncbi:hypothetical protein ABEF92_003212 [Exophiala dermatitidis]|uniref:Uncharacterized protein n=1 Tax=Exophiala dermatitidis (strain ATCC 34100 / CBS 525.76 / NIH/UT8656) TaxID=858893 RepID=H6CBA7_EXODN|nr:uncharacterized protein HMPREF1120_08994 [Exophiala dermatitidis NIH/UT8656]EHY61054.1 hypothetical protein HMPREF1120_08994 [Exophiala dermatitidis NIH/UT8656]